MTTNWTKSNFIKINSWFIWPHMTIISAPKNSPMSKKFFIFDINILIQTTTPFTMTNEQTQVSQSPIVCGRYGGQSTHQLTRAFIKGIFTCYGFVCINWRHTLSWESQFYCRYNMIHIITLKDKQTQVLNSIHYNNYKNNTIYNYDYKRYTYIWHTLTYSAYTTASHTINASMHHT